MARRRLLFVTDVTPLPLDSGQRVRVRHLVAACRRVIDVTLVAPRPDEPSDCRQIEAECDHVVWVGDDTPTSGWHRAKLTATTAVSMAGLPFPSKLARYLPYVMAIEQAGPSNVDLIWAERPHIAKLCAPFLRKTILDLDDLDHIKIARQLKVQGAARGRAVGAYRFAYYRYLEIDWARRFFASVVCSDEDRVYLARNGCDNTIVVPNGSSLSSHVHARVRSSASPLRTVFLGNLAYEPNADAMAYFVSHLLPPLLQVAPDATFDVIGPNASNDVRRHFGASVRFRGFVDDLGTALAEYDVMVVPLRVGGGTKLKVLDAMANGVPVVATRIGAEGLGLRHGTSAWIAETPSEFVDGIVRLKRDPELAERVAASARGLVVERFSWPAIEERLAQWLSEARPPS
jgi:glycosyltransferase involved in cell wall biosynthesis